MKKLFAFILVIALSAAMLIGCSSGGIDEVKLCYENSAPKRIEVVSTQSFGSHLLDLTTTMVEGVLETGEAAGYKTVVGDRMRSLEEGSGTEILDYIENVNTVEWYRASKGTSADKGKTWNKDGVSFVPAAGLIAINLDASLLKNVEFDGKTLSFLVEADDVAKVFGEGVVGAVANVECSITVAGRQVTSILIEWIVPAAESGGIGEDVEVSIKATYGYDIEPVTL